MPDAIELVQRYIAAWNETDPGRRRALVEQAFTSDALYLDPLMQGEGHAGIAAMIGGAQQHFPGHRFSLHGEPQLHNDRIRFGWALAPEGGAIVARGTDFGVLAEGRLRSVTGFIDQAPGA